MRTWLRDWAPILVLCACVGALVAVVFAHEIAR